MARKGLSLLPQDHVYFSFFTRFARKGESGYYGGRPWGANKKGVQS